MPLAGKATLVEVGGAIVRLRPSLRAAIVLEREHGGFASLVSALQAGSVTATASILEECGDQTAPTALILDDSTPIGPRLMALAPALITFVLDLADVAGPEYEREEGAAPGEPVSLAEALADLFGIATGILGWSPAEAYAATAAEIYAAFHQRHAMACAQAGNPPPKLRRTGPDNGFLDSAGLAALATMNSI